MKTKLTILTLVLLIAGVGFLACQNRSGPGSDQNEKAEIDYYTCPMHPQIHEDHPGECPICHMKLVPVYKQGAMPPAAEGDGPSVLIPTERQQLIGIKTEKVRKQKVVKEIRTSGRVAFDPDLAVAMKEYQEILRSVPSLKASAEKRLRLMGLSEEEIASIKNKKPSSSFVLPDEKGPLWVYAPLYESEMDLVKPGMEAVISTPSGDEKILTGTIRSIDPVVDAMTRSVRARIEVPEGGALLKPDTFVDVAIQVDLGETLAVPKSAVVATGTRRVVFVVHEGKHFTTREISTSTEAGDWVVITDGLKEGETIVTSSTFMVDSESQLKAAVAGGHQH